MATAPVPSSQALEANKALVLRYFVESHNRHNLAVIEELLEPAYAAANLRWMRMELAAFPDAHFAVEDVVAEGDRVVLRCTFTGTHRGEFRLRDWVLPATGAAVTARPLFMYRVADGKIAGGWLGLDVLDLFLQLGATLTLPAPRGG